MSMMFHYTRVIFVMLFVFAMVAWPLSHLPSDCICGASFTVDHAFTCSHGGYPILRHNEIRDITAQLMSEVCPNVATEPILQTVSNKQFVHHSANTKSAACLDVRAQGF